MKLGVKSIEINFKKQLNFKIDPQNILSLNKLRLVSNYNAIKFGSLFFLKKIIMMRLLTGIKKLFMSYGMFLPVFFVLLITILDIQSGTIDKWNEYLLYNLLTIGLGYQMIAFGVMHIFFGEFISGFIGWEKGSPFQYEVGLADFGMGVLGILCGYFSDDFWLATIIISSIFLWGCVIGHLRDMAINKNFNPGSAGFIFWWGLLMPIALISLYIIY